MLYEVITPFIVNRKSMTGTGQLPKFEEDLFKIDKLDYYLVPTAEVPVTNIHQNETIPVGSLPLRYTAYTPCFRKEAGSYGKDRITSYNVCYTKLLRCGFGANERHRGLHRSISQPC